MAYGAQMGVPFDIPIAILMYRKDLYDKHGLEVPTTMDAFMETTKALHEAESGNGISGHHRPAEVRPLFVGMRLDHLALGPWRLDLQQGRHVLRQ